MIKSRRNITTNSIRLANHRANHEIKSMRKRLADFDNHDHGKDGYCKFCTFIRPDPIGGAAMTNAECGLCDTVMTFGSTVTDVLCKSCAEHNQLCRRCGADLDLTNRDTIYPFQKE